MPTDYRMRDRSNSDVYANVTTPIAIAGIWLALYLVILFAGTGEPVAPFDWRFAALF